MDRNIVCFLAGFYTADSINVVQEAKGKARIRARKGCRNLEVAIKNTQTEQNLVSRDS